MLHGYCIARIDAPPPPAELLGLEGAPVRTSTLGSLALWFSEIEGGRPTLAGLQAHERVVQSALRSSTPLPLRFGARFADAQEIRARLDPRGAEFARTLAWLDDRVEVAIRVRFSGSEPQTGADVRGRPGPEPLLGSGPEGSGRGRAYLEHRRRRLEAGAEVRANAARFVTEVAREFADLEPAGVLSILAEGAILGTVAQLVHREEIAALRTRVSRLGGTRPDLEIDLSGPWAPYSFVGDESTV